MTLEGVDIASAVINPGALVAAGKRFVCRYLPVPGTNPAMTLSSAEARAIMAAGLELVANYETTGQTFRGGFNAGVADARAADAALVGLGLTGAPVIFSCDTDPTGLEAEITAYADGLSSVIGKARIGIYGGYSAISAVLGGGHATYGWQTLAWSGGQIYAGCHLYQYEVNTTAAGYSVDLNRTIVSDTNYGQVGAASAPPTVSRGGPPPMLTIAPGAQLQIPLGDWGKAWCVASAASVPVAWNISKAGQTVTGDNNGKLGFAPWAVPISGGADSLFIHNQGEAPVVVTLG